MESTQQLLKKEDLRRALPLAEAAKRLHGRGGRPPCVETARAWCDPSKGYKVPGLAGGERIVLKSFRIGQDIMVLPEWVDEFEGARLAAGLRAMRAAGGVPPAGEAKRPERSRRAAHRRAEERLDRAGVV